MMYGVATAAAISLSKIIVAGPSEASYKVREMSRRAPGGEVKEPQERVGGRASQA
ncbi:hypothetical protein RHMOL_Rhmol02G0006300 [Rhododendron molle]|uniref:Uncharacterized protein n=2 Tax=Rhododendron molle TaxID=49168 RepID=A0ACC0PK33_RHOML|nr:hypothetical protein RHMOL_Rhmol02G0006300 [Rhododendron molle]KAI8566015.1 hypothetical protein RHMOL_Rhmol02G0006300 [Rhododendron molle]